MARPDLPDGFGGWQVVDATPQETSDGEHTQQRHQPKCQQSDTVHTFLQTHLIILF